MYNMLQPKPAYSYENCCFPVVANTVRYTEYRLKYFTFQIILSRHVFQTRKLRMLSACPTFPLVITTSDFMET